MGGLVDKNSFGTAQGRRETSLMCCEMRVAGKGAPIRLTGESSSEPSSYAAPVTCQFGLVQPIDVSSAMVAFGVCLITTSQLQPFGGTWIRSPSRSVLTWFLWGRTLSWDARDSHTWDFLT